ncbi:MAG TPA: hypothetical protein VFH29_09345, partial [Anaerolineales bacterium]|nr:hypothetical protein [Anaerolineales bacterium]
TSALAQSSAMTLNNGGTPGFSRYALWYIPLWLPPTVFVLRNLAGNRWMTASAVVALVGGLAFSAAFYRPNMPARYTVPTALSYAVQRYLPNLYNPPAEIFAERYSGLGDGADFARVAVLGPECHKLLIMQPNSGGITEVAGVAACGIEEGKLAQTINQNLRLGIWPTTSDPVYVRLTESEVDQSRNAPILGTWYPLTSAGAAPAYLAEGWHKPESWGTWSSQRHAVLLVWCPRIEPSGSEAVQLELDLAPFTAPGRDSVGLRVISDGSEVWKGQLRQRETLTLAVPADACAKNQPIRLEFEIANPASPLSLGLSQDARELGIALHRLRFTH